MSKIPFSTIVYCFTILFIYVVDKRLRIRDAIEITFFITCSGYMCCRFLHIRLLLLGVPTFQEYFTFDLHVVRVTNLRLGYGFIMSFQA